MTAISPPEIEPRAPVSTVKVDAQLAAIGGYGTLSEEEDEVGIT